jgi:hypothetical protein
MSLTSYQWEDMLSRGFFAMSTNTPFVMTPTAIAFDTSLPPLVRLLWQALEDFSGNNRTCWPGYEALAKKVGCTARWIPYLIKRLVKAGLLVVQYRQGKTNIYTLLGRVARQKATQEQTAPVPPKPDKDDPKQPTKTNNNRAYRPFNGNKKKKEGIDFTKYAWMNARR